MSGQESYKDLIHKEFKKPLEDIYEDIFLRVEAFEDEKWYDEVWTIVNNEFYDKTYNGQNWSLWKNRYDNKLKTEADAIIAINTMVRSLDDNYSHFIPPNR